jgi:hypothetical protein
MLRAKASAWIGIAVFLFGFLLDMGLQQAARPLAAEGIYFQGWSSEDLMQSVPIEDLRANPLRTLAYIHIQPPGFDLIRAGLAQLWPSLEIHDLLRRVDESLYLLWAVFFGALGVILYQWISKLGGTALGLVGALLFLLHPASLYYATLLDGTFLSAFLVLWACYLLWRLKNGERVPIVLLSCVVLALFFTRSLFQLPALAVFAVSLMLFRVPRRQLVTFVTLTGIVSGLLVAKQYYLFRTFSTSTFSSLNLANSLGVGWDAATYSKWLVDQKDVTANYGPLPDVLVRKTKLDGQRNFNNIAYLQLQDYFLQKYEAKLLGSPPGDLARSYLQNAMIYFLPSSSYTAGNVIVERLPWREIYDRVFSAPILPLLLGIAAALALYRMIHGKSIWKSLGLTLPALFVLGASILFEKGENMRFKFWLEPVMFVFLISEFHSLATMVRGRKQTPSA